MSAPDARVDSADDTDAADEQARAQVYALIAHLFHAPPDAALLAQLQALADAPAAGSLLGASWHELAAAAQRLPAHAVREEFEALFVAIGKPEVFLFGSYYLAGALNEKPLALLRDDLRALKLERSPDAVDTEDHLSSLCETMRQLITGDDPAVCNLAAQQRFFERHLHSWSGQLCDTLQQHPRADFYRALAGFTREFLAVESQAFDLLDA